MKYVTAIIVLLILGLGWRFTHQGSDIIQSRPVDFDPAPLLEMETLGLFDPDLHFRRDLMVIYYFSELSCETCTTRELVHVADWHTRYKQQADFFLVVHGRDPIYLSNLKRLGQVSYPILLEEELGQAGFNGTVIAIADKSTGRLLAQYHPIADPETAHLIEDMETILRKAIAAKTNRAASAHNQNNQRISL